ncbi:MAG: class I SAM-dependent methyltransferase [Acidobacteriia bacterium]|nr:class I SAM-dependent methyltransferase [Terriglobia bacterium]
MENDLAEIAGRYDTDKAVHTHYLRNYEQYFGNLRSLDIKLLELGIKAGGSLLLWRDFFSRGLIVGLDIEPVALADHTGRIRTYQGMQQDTVLLDRIACETAPDGFDIIIDDCAHIGVLARASFWHLFDNHLKRGGIYVIEDWGTGYWDEWVDGVSYSPRRRKLSPSLYRITRVLARLRQSRFGRMPLGRSILSLCKASVLKMQYHSHDYGMVGFVKELIDELGTADITHRQFGSAPVRKSKFAEMHLAQSHLFIVKA